MVKFVITTGGVVPKLTNFRYATSKVWGEVHNVSIKKHEFGMR